MNESHVAPKASEWPTRRVFEWNNYDPSYSSRIDIRQEQQYRTSAQVMRITLRDTTKNASASVQIPRNEAISMALAIIRAAGANASVIEQLTEPEVVLSEQEKLATAAMRSVHVPAEQVPDKHY